ncbi:General transcription factor IIH subunit 2 [Ancistrocladus abbreviatus]
MYSIEHREVSNSRGRRVDEEPEEEEDEDEENGRGMDAWERTYADERSWESLQEDESGLLRPIDSKILHHAQYRRRLHSISSAATAARIQKGLIRYLYIVLDFSRAAAEMDFKPSRMASVANHVEAFIREFFDQNPLSQIGLIIIKDGIAHCLTDLGGSPEAHIKALMTKLECSGDASLQNALELVDGYLNQIPSYGHREVLIIYSALSTCDPGDIMETVQKCKKSKIRCSIVGLAAEMFICKHICQETGGSYSVALDESHLKELLLDHAPPPPAIAEYAIANLIKMGFPQRAADGVISICSCHKEVKVGGGYTCPRCKARVCELPTECRICGLTLVSSPHLARSYHHLFPVTPFDEVSPMRLSKPAQRLPQKCFGCQQSLLNPGNMSAYWVTCPKCRKYFCLDCDIYIHESLHNCPGCTSLRHLKSVVEE